jgi:hypothetical protein
MLKQTVRIVTIVIWKVKRLRIDPQGLSWICSYFRLPAVSNMCTELPQSQNITALGWWNRRPHRGVGQRNGGETSRTFRSARELSFMPKVCYHKIQPRNGPGFPQLLPHITNELVGLEVTLWTCTREALGSNICRGKGYPDWAGCYLVQVTTSSFLIPSNSLIILSFDATYMLA